MLEKKHVVVVVPALGKMPSHSIQQQLYSAYWSKSEQPKIYTGRRWMNPRRYTDLGCHGNSPHRFSRGKAYGTSNEFHEFCANLSNTLNLPYQDMRPTGEYKKKNSAQTATWDEKRYTLTSIVFSGNIQLIPLMPCTYHPSTLCNSTWREESHQGIIPAQVRSSTMAGKHVK
jgi:hypothetical protein